VETGVFFAVHLLLLKSRSSREPQFELQQDLVQELQFKESSRYKKIEEKPAEAKTWGIDHGSRKV
jgi:hypothetical protein